MTLILASKSASRQAMLRQARVPFDAIPAVIDEEAIKASLLAEGAKPRDIADALAEYKARKISAKHPGAVVLGSDQVLEFDARLLSKPRDRQDLQAQLTQMSGKPHKLISAAVIYEGGEPKWRAVKPVSLRMHPLSEVFITDYIARNWEDVRHSVGGYHIEGEGARLFAAIEGDYFAILGMPLLEVLAYLTQTGVITR